MKLPRRKFLHLAAGAVTLQAVSRIARAQTYPTRPVRLIVGFTPGGPTDIFARLIGQWLSARFGQPFIIENRPGAGSTIGIEWHQVAAWHCAGVGSARYPDGTRWRMDGCPGL